MKVDIYGMSDATITLNSVGIILRGKGVTPSGMARSVEIKNEHQKNEIDQLAKMRLIRYEVVEEKKEEPKQETQPKIIKEIENKESIKKEKSKTSEVKSKRSKNIEVKKSEKIDIPAEVDVDNMNNVVVMTEGGPVGATMSRSMIGEAKEAQDVPTFIEDEEDFDVSKVFEDEPETKSVVASKRGKTKEVKSVDKTLLDLGIDLDDHKPDDSDDAFIEL